MTERTVSRRASLGLPPGTLVHVGEGRSGPVRMTVLDYSATEFQERPVSVDECQTFRDAATVTWINVDGLHDIELIRRLGESFKLHPLLLEDIVNTRQRPKVDEYDEALFIVVKMLYVDEATGEIAAEQVSLIAGRNFVISFQEREGDVFQTIRQRIRNAKGRIRSMGADYLAYSLIDAIVDNYFVILEGVGERLEGFEEELVENPAPQASRRIHQMKQQVLFLRKSVWPLREVISSLARGDSPLIDDVTLPYLRDVYDHTIQVVDTIEAFRDRVSGMRDAYMTAVSNRMNEVMKVLTIIATIFIPLTFIAGVYGMNFGEQMPELSWPYGYVTVWVVMVAVAVVMIVYFKRRKWL